MLTNFKIKFKLLIFTFNKFNTTLTEMGAKFVPKRLKLTRNRKR